MSRFSLAGKVAVVTGASSGLGVDFARGLAEAGADTVICARRAERLERTRKSVELLGRRSLAVEADVTQPDDCERVVADALRELRRVDVLVNNAGVGTAVPATRETPEQFRSVIDVNLLGTYWMAQACARVMTPGSSIVNVGERARLAIRRPCRRPRTLRARPAASVSRATWRSSGPDARASA